MKKASVLVIADEAISRRALREMLSKYSELLIVGEGDTSKAVGEAQKLEPDVVVIHAVVPVTKTLQLVAGLHAKSGVVLLSREPQEAYVRACFAAGALAYILMQADPGDLLAGIRAAVARRHFLDPLLKNILLDTLLRDERQPLEILSARELQVLKMLAYGYTNQQIANKLSLSRKSVDTYRQRMAEKLNLTNRVEIVRYALSMGLMGNDADLKNGSDLGNPT